MPVVGQQACQVGDAVHLPIEVGVGFRGAFVEFRLQLLAENGAQSLLLEVIEDFPDDATNQEPENHGKHRHRCPPQRFLQ